MRTDDGIEIGWKIKFGFDPADPLVKDEDPDGDGFTNLEEFLAGTNPIQKEDSPAKESKLKSRAGEPVAMAVSFPEKSGGVFTLRFQIGNKRREFKGKVNDSFWLMAGPDGMEIFTDEKKKATAQNRAKEAKLSDHVIPLRITAYEEKIEKIKDAKAGGIEVEVDNSVLNLERHDGLGGTQKFIFSTTQRPQVATWDVGDIRFYSPASGGREVGPYRMGENFDYEGKKFSIIGREGKKIQIRNLSEEDKTPFWVPPDLETPAATLTP